MSQSELRNLLDDAAFAVGRCLHRRVEDRAQRGDFPDFHCLDCGARHIGHEPWNPQLDDGVSRRLQVTLCIDLEIVANRWIAGRRYGDKILSASAETVPYAFDSAAAARLATLKCAALIGQEKRAAEGCDRG